MARLIERCRIVGCWAGPALVMAAGCSAPSSLCFEQPAGTPAEARILLTSRQVYWSQVQDDYRVLAEMPLPGAQTGRPTYLLYVRMRAEPGAPVARDVRGFIIQTRGARRGLSPVVRAVVRPDSPPAGRGPWRVQVQLTFEDRSTLTGTLRADRNDWRVKHFETRTNAADVQSWTANGPVSAAGLDGSAETGK